MSGSWDSFLSDDSEEDSEDITSSLAEESQEVFGLQPAGEYLLPHELRDAYDDQDARWHQYYTDALSKEYEDSEAMSQLVDFIWDIEMEEWHSRKIALVPPGVIKPRQNTRRYREYLADMMEISHAENEDLLFDDKTTNTYRKRYYRQSKALEQFSEELEDSFPTPPESNDVDQLLPPVMDDEVRMSTQQELRERKRREAEKRRAWRQRMKQESQAPPPKGESMSIEEKDSGPPPSLEEIVQQYPWRSTGRDPYTLSHTIAYMWRSALYFLDDHSGLLPSFEIVRYVTLAKNRVYFSTRQTVSRELYGKVKETGVLGDYTVETREIALDRYKHYILVIGLHGMLYPHEDSGVDRLRGFARLFPFPADSPKWGVFLEDVRKYLMLKRIQ